MNKSDPNWVNPCQPGHWAFDPSQCNFRAGLDFCAYEVAWDTASMCAITLDSGANLTISSGPLTLPTSVDLKYSDGESSSSNTAIEGNGASFNAGGTGSRYIMTESVSSSSGRRLNARIKEQIRNMRRLGILERGLTDLDEVVLEVKEERPTRSQFDRWQHLLNTTAPSHMFRRVPKQSAKKVHTISTESSYAISQRRRLASSNNNILTINSLSLTGFGTSTDDGGSLYLVDYGTINLISVSFMANNGRQGGAVYISNATRVTVTNCIFENNRGTSGAAIFLRNVDEVIIDGSTFTSNIAKAVGGAIVIDNSRTVIIRNCHFEGNLAEYHGGAVSINGVSVETTLVGHLI